MRIFIFAFLILFFGGCGPKINSQYFNSSISSNQNLDYATIADDMTNFITSSLSPNNAIIYISTSDGDKKFYDYLTDRLRNLGFGISNDTTIKNLNFISYTIQVQDNMAFVTYNINESKVNRVFKISNNKLEPTAYTTILKG